jgi:hypothetical protein
MNVLNTNIMSFYHPTKVVFLDDNQGFLDAIALELHIPLMAITNSIRWRSLRSEATLQFKCITYLPYFPIY